MIKVLGCIHNFDYFRNNNCLMTKQLLICQPNCWMVGGCYQEIIDEVCRKLKEYGAVKDEDGSGYFCSV